MRVHAPEASHEPLELVEAGSERSVALRLLAAGREEHEDVVAGHMVLALVVHPLHGHAPPLPLLAAGATHVPGRVLLQLVLRDRRQLHQRGDGEERDRGGRWDGAPGEVQRRLDVLVTGGPRENVRSRDETPRSRGATVRKPKSASSGSKPEVWPLDLWRMDQRRRPRRRFENSSWQL